MIKKTAKAMATARRNWKTTAFGFLSSSAAYVALNPGQFLDAPKWVPMVAGFIFMGGIAGMGIVGKDGDKTGTAGAPK